MYVYTAYDYRYDKLSDPVFSMFLIVGNNNNNNTLALMHHVICKVTC